MNSTSPGYGTRQLHLGQASSEVVKVLGKPSQQKVTSDLREYWVYPELNFEAIVSRRTGRLLSLFFHDGSSLAGGEFFGRSVRDIHGLFGEAHKSGGGTTFSDGECIDRWIAYETGISFFFNRAGRVKTVCVSAPKRTRKRLSVVRHSESHSAHVAALRRL